MADLKEKIKQLPCSPGCYLYRNQQGQIIYVGKSKALRKRVAQYFTGIEKKERKLQQLVREIADFDYILTETEIDALLLECKLIKTHLPKFNAVMKRKKNRPYLCISMKAEYPGIYIRATAPVDAECFGCFYHQEDAEEVLRLLNAVWRVPLCGREYFDQDKQTRPCLNHQIGLCDAPCQGRIDREDYLDRIRSMVRFLRGQKSRLIPEMKKEMQQYALDLEFEKAALIHGRIAKLEQLQKQMRKYQMKLAGRDFCVLLRAWREDCFYLVYVHDGVAMIKHLFEFTASIESVTLETFINAIFDSQYNIEDGSMFSTCLVSISADKLYIDISSAVIRRNKTALINSIMKGYRDFIEGV